MRKKLNKKYDEIKSIVIDPQTTPRVLLLYCTCNDFNAAALSACRKQDYPNFKTIILDDSNKFEYIKEINKFYVQHANVEIVRRKNKSLFKIKHSQTIFLDFIQMH